MPVGPGHTSALRFVERIIEHVPGVRLCALGELPSRPGPPMASLLEALAQLALAALGEPATKVVFLEDVHVEQPEALLGAPLELGAETLAETEDGFRVVNVQLRCERVTGRPAFAHARVRLGQRTPDAWRTAAPTLPTRPLRDHPLLAVLASRAAETPGMAVDLFVASPVETVVAVLLPQASMPEGRPPLLGAGAILDVLLECLSTRPKGLGRDVFRMDRMTLQSPPSPGRCFLQARFLLDAGAELSVLTEQGRMLARLEGVEWCTGRASRRAAGPKLDAELARVDSEALGCKLVEQRFYVPWKDCAGVDGSVLASSYVGWFHRLRDLMLGVELGRQFRQEMLSTTGGGALLRSEVAVLHPATAYDLLRLQLWVTAITEQSVVWAGQFDRLEDGRAVSVATVSSAGIYRRPGAATAAEATALPPHHAALYQPYLARTTQTQSPPPESWPPLAGAPLYDGGAGPRAGRLVSTLSLQPGLVDSDLVGNVNNVCYFVWQEHVRDLFFHSLGREMLVPRNRPAGALRTERLRTEHLRELMPFQVAEAQLFLEQVTDSGARLRTDFFRKTPGGASEKIGTGRQSVLALQLERDGSARPASWPADVMAALLPLEAP